MNEASLSDQEGDGSGSIKDRQTTGDALESTLSMQEEPDDEHEVPTESESLVKSVRRGSIKAEALAPGVSLTGTVHSAVAVFLDDDRMSTV